MDVWDKLSAFLDRHGIAIVVTLWFMLRMEKLISKLISRINRQLITMAVIAHTLDLDEEQDRLMRAASDEESGEKRLP